MYSHKEHGEHNESVCALLLKEGNFPDWVVTTAFYSALHFVSAKLFPLTIDKKVISSLEKYKLTLPQHERVSLHEARLRAVRNHKPEISEDFRWLYDESRNARYNSYKVDVEDARLAKRKLEAIRGNLFPKK